MSIWHLESPMALADDLRLALDAVAFGRSLDFEPDDWQARVLRSTSKRQLLNCCRQSGKSTVASLLAVHQSLFVPDSLTLLLSPGLRQSSELFRKVGQWLARLPEPPTMPEDNRLSCVLANGSRIVSLPASEATVRGFSDVNLIIEDEASRVPDDLYRAVRPMLAVSGGWMVLMGTPFGKRGHFHQEWLGGGPAWERLEITAHQCPRIAPAFLAEERAALGDHWYRQEYECQFLDAVNQVFDYESVMAALSADVVPLFVVAPPEPAGAYAVTV
jgi:hypothetical protein